MRPSWKRRTFALIYGFIALRMVIDLFLAAIISTQTGSWITGGGMWLLCWAFYLLLFFGVRSGTFHGTYGRKVYYWREPAAWWVVFGFIVLFHLAVTVLFAWTANDWTALSESIER